MEARKKHGGELIGDRLDRALSLPPSSAENSGREMMNRGAPEMPTGTGIYHSRGGKHLDISSFLYMRLLYHSAGDIAIQGRSNDNDRAQI